MRMGGKVVDHFIQVFWKFIPARTRFMIGSEKYRYNKTAKEKIVLLGKCFDQIKNHVAMCSRQDFETEKLLADGTKTIHS